MKVSNTFGMVKDTKVTNHGIKQAKMSGKKLKQYIDKTTSSKILLNYTKLLKIKSQLKIKKDLLKLINVYEVIFNKLLLSDLTMDNYVPDRDNEVLIDVWSVQEPKDVNDYSLRYLISKFDYLSLFIHRIIEEDYNNKKYNSFLLNIGSYKQLRNYSNENSPEKYNYPTLLQQYIKKLNIESNNPFDTCFVSDLQRTHQTLDNVLHGMEIYSHIIPVVLPCASELSKKGTYGNCDEATSNAPFYTKMARENKTSVSLKNGRMEKNDDRNFKDLYIPFYNGNARGTLYNKVLHCRNTNMISLAIYYLIKKHNKKLPNYYFTEKGSKEHLMKYINTILSDNPEVKPTKKSWFKWRGGKARKTRKRK